MISGIELFSFQDLQNQNNLDPESLLERIEEGDHQGVLDWLDAGRTLDDLLGLGYQLSVAYHCFSELSAAQLKEILNKLPEGTSLPDDALHFILDDNDGSGIEKMQILMPELNRFNYSFDWIYQRILQKGSVDWIEFLLDHAPSNLDLNLWSFSIDDIDIHGLARMKLLATQWSIQLKIGNQILKQEQRYELSLMLDKMHRLIEKMEHHPKIDIETALEHIEKLKSYYYFEGDPQYEKDCAFIVDATTFDGLEKHVAAGFDLYAPIGPFSIVLFEEISSDVKWIELLAFFFDYKESKLIDLMDKYNSDLL